MEEMESERRRKYREYIASPEWEVIRKAAYRRADNRCNRCKRRGVLHAHHVTYARFGGGELPEDIEVLCERCHMAHHARPKQPRQKKKKRGKRRKEPRNLLPLDDPAYIRVMEMQAMRRGKSPKLAPKPSLPVLRQWKDSNRKKAEKRRKKKERRQQLREERQQYLIANPLPPPIRPGRELASAPRRLIRLSDGTLVPPEALTEEMI